MPTWILRKSVDNERVGPPRRCGSPTAIARVAGTLSVEEQMACLLAKNEITAVDAIDGQRKIYRAHRLVGYIVLLTTE